LQLFNNKQWAQPSADELPRLLMPRSRTINVVQLRMLAPRCGFLYVDIQKHMATYPILMLKGR